MGQIGRPVREIEFIPADVPDTIPDDLPAAPEPQPTEPEKVPVPA